LVHLRNEGYVRAIGVSNFNIEQDKNNNGGHRRLPGSNQIQLHPLNTQKKMLEFAGENNIKITAWRTILKGELDIPLLQTLAKKLNKTPAQIVLRWHIQNGVIVIPKSVHKERIIENSKIFDFNLSDDDMKAIDALNKDMFFGITPEEMDLRY
jgi:diketogulonate reductase-like aldo/keto reductase